MRVLFVTHSFPREREDVAGSFILRLARALTDDGADVLVLAPSATALTPSDVIDGVAVRRFRYATRSRETLAYTGTLAEQVERSFSGKVALAGLLSAGSIAVRRTAASYRPDVVHAHWWFPAGLLALGALIDTPLVTTLHGSDVRLAGRTKGGPALFRRVMHRSNEVTAVSEWLASEARAMVPGLGVSIEPMPAAVELFIPTRTTEDGTLTARISRRILFVGRLNAQKGLALLLEAFAATSTNATLDVVGDGEQRAMMVARAASLGIASRVRWRGSMTQERLVELYNGAAAVVIPSENEGLGLVAVEAQLCETPVIACRSGGITDLIEDGVTGILTPPGDAPAFAAAIDLIVSDPDGARRIGRAGRVTALDRFTPARVAARYLKIYERAISVSNSHDENC